MNLTQHAATDASMAQEIKTHHAAMVADLDRLTGALRDAEPETRAGARMTLAKWFEDVLVPHADEEERTTYAAAAGLPEGRLLIEAMVREHVLIKRLVALCVQAPDGAVAAAYGRAVLATFDSHQSKENEIILPLLLQAQGVSLAEVVGESHGHHHVHDGHQHGHQH